MPCTVHSWLQQHQPTRARQCPDIQLSYSQQLTDLVAESTHCIISSPAARMANLLNTEYKQPARSLLPCLLLLQGQVPSDNTLTACVSILQHWAGPVFSCVGGNSCTMVADLTCQRVLHRIPGTRNSVETTCQAPQNKLPSSTVTINCGNVPCHPLCAHLQHSHPFRQVAGYQKPHPDKSKLLHQLILWHQYQHRTQSQ